MPPMAQPRNVGRRRRRVWGTSPTPLPTGFAGTLTAQANPIHRGSKIYHSPLPSDLVGGQRGPGSPKGQGVREKKQRQGLRGNPDAAKCTGLDRWEHRQTQADPKHRPSVRCPWHEGVVQANGWCLRGRSSARGGGNPGAARHARLGRKVRNQAAQWIIHIDSQRTVTPAADRNAG
jgi:hypothetical protein